MDPQSQLYTRQQITDLTGIDSSSLNYWSREGLLVPSEGGTGRGSHRRFDFVQVNIAAVFGQLRRFGLNITALRSLAKLLQSAATMGLQPKLHPSNYSVAAELASALHMFRAGAPVMVPLHSFDEERPANLKGPAYSEWLTAKRPATTEEELAQNIIGVHVDYDTADAIKGVAELLAPGRETDARLYNDLTSEVLAPGYSESYSWLLAFRADGSWRVEFGDGAKFFDNIHSESPEDFGPGIFLPVSGIIRKMWKLKSYRAIRREQGAERLKGLLAEKGIVAEVRPHEGEETGFSVDAPGVDAAALDAAINSVGYRFGRQD